MKKNYTKPFLVAILYAFFSLSFNQIKAQIIVALTNTNEITWYDVSNPQSPYATFPILGLVAGQNVVGIDFRPNTGELYLLGYNSADNSANLYTYNQKTANTTKIGTSPITLSLGNGEKVGFDFNPTVDRIRVVSSTGFNYRLHPTTGAIAFTDGKLSFASTDMNNGKNPNIGASAYTNSYIGAGTTTLFNFDDSLNIITSQVPPNDGILNTIGSTGISASLISSVSGFDIYKDTVTLANVAYLSLRQDAGVTNLYTVNLTNGNATSLGTIGSANVNIIDIAVEIKRASTMSVSGNMVYALQGAANLISFDSENPENIISLKTITGITVGQNIASMDMRPKTNGLYVLGYNPTNNESQLYMVDAKNASATAVGTPVNLMLGTASIGFDFNPTVDRIRVVSANNNNYRLHPETGAIAATDTAIAFGMADVNSGKDPFISSVAYTNSFDGATTTQLFGYDDSLNVFVLQSPPNRGTLTTIAPSNLKVNLADASTDFDIYYDKTAKTNLGFMVANTGTSGNDSLYTVNFTTGMVMNKGMIGFGVGVRDIAIALDTTITSGIFAGKKAASNLKLNLFPNPVTDFTTVNFDLNKAGVVEINVINTLGQIVETSGSRTLPAGNNSYQIATINYKSGIYIIELKINGEKKATVKAIK